jgi:hypothetical protein
MIKIALKWIGVGEYIPGVPPRDLTGEEAEKYAGKIEATEENLGRKLYEKPKAKKKVAKEEAKDGE